MRKETLLAVICANVFLPSFGYFSGLIIYHDLSMISGTTVTPLGANLPLFLGALFSAFSLLATFLLRKEIFGGVWK